MPHHRAAFVWTMLATSAALASSLAAPARAQTAVSADDFESANTLAWSLTVGDPTLTPADAFRFADLDLRDPHLFVNVPVFGCSDFTDTGLPLGLAPAFNDQLATAITTDADDDGFLDASLAVLMRPFDRNAVAVRQDAGSLPCTAPLATTSCALDHARPPRTSPYSGQMAGQCLDALMGTTSGYVPAVSGPIAPCFVTAPASGSLDIGGIRLPLVDVQLAASFGPDPVDELTGGLLRGFLSEAAANSVTIPADVPLVGGQPFSILLPGGQGNCAGGDDRDTYQGISGWWFYLEWSGERVPYTGP